MRILSISHSAVVAGYHDRYSEIVSQEDVDLTVLVPKKWLQFNHRVALEKTSDPHYQIVSCQPICWGLRNHGLRNATHIYPKMKKFLKRVHPDVVELWEEPFSAVAATTIRSVRKTRPEAKVIFFSAQNIPRKYPPPFSHFERYTYAHADFAFVMNEEAERVIREKGWRKGSLVLPLGVNPERFRKLDVAGLRSELGLANFTVGFVGKLEVQKGILDLVRAVAKLGKKTNLLIIGSGPLEKQLKELIGEIGLSERTRILPAVSYDELPRYLNCLDVLVLPSLTLFGLKEQFGRVLIEAMSCEVPVIGSDSGEIPAVVGDAGLIFPEGNIDALADKISFLVREPHCAQELSRKGRRRVEERYTWSLIARQQVSVYKELMLAGRGTASSFR